MRDMSVNLRWPVLAIAAAALVTFGAGTTYLVLRSSDSPTEQRPSDMAHTPAPPSSPTAPAGAAPSGGALPDVIVTLSQEAVDRAGITVAPVGTGGVRSGLRLPGVVEPNAYRQVFVTPLVAGRITRVLVPLGERVRRGQTLAEIFSPELAEAHARHTSARAALEAHEQELRRTQKLVEIGAASRQELERAHADHAMHIANVQSARSRLELLGVPAAAIESSSSQEASATADVPAPIDGVITERLANLGLNVDQTSKLFTVVDLSTVWIVADLYEKDFRRVRVGSPATVTTAADPSAVLKGQVDYIDPQVSAQTRTARLRVEVRNPRNELRLGMYADVNIAGASAEAVPTIPRGAVQNVGDRQVVYLVDPNERGRFTEREVRLGPAAGEQVQVLSGVTPGDVVVTEGSFFVRAERERLGLRAPAAARPPKGTDVQTAKVVVGEQGYEPATVTLRAGVPARITFVRTTDNTCGTEVVFPSLNIKRALPLNEPVVVELTPDKAGEIAFACGMNMLSGAVVAQ